MPRDLVYERPNRGLNIASKPSLLWPGQVHRAKNVEFTRTSAKRRRGRRVAYQWAIAATNAVTMLKRYYQIKVSGAVAKFFVKAITGSTNRIFYATNGFGVPLDWSDDTASVVVNWEQINTPDDGTNTLYFKDGAGYSSTQVTFTDGAMKHALSAKGWLYCWPDWDSTDDAVKTKNVAIRTKCNDPGLGQSFLHGLVPPNALVEDDTAHSDANVPWKINVIEAVATKVVGMGPVIAVHTDGTIHAAYLLNDASTKFGVRYAKGTAPARGELPVWEISEIIAVNTTGPSVETDMSIAVDVEGHPHIAFVENTTFDLVEYSRETFGIGTPWTKETIDSTRDCRGPTLRIAPDGHRCVAYYDNTNDDLRYGFKLPGDTWTTELVDNGGAYGSTNTGNDPSIAVESDGRVHCSYYDATGGNLRYARRSSPGSGGTWSSFEAIDTTGDVGAGSSIALNSAGIPGVTYQDTTNSRTKYAQKPATWSIVENFGDTESFVTGQRSGLVYSRSDIPQALNYHITANEARLYFWERSGGTWEGALVDANASGLGLRASIFRDSRGYMHIAYAEYATGVLNYAVGILVGYQYRLTAEYDDGILGESGPSAAALVAIPKPIDEDNPHTLNLDAASSRYDMTNDVTRINVWRSFADQTAETVYRKVGFVTCTAGAPTADFVDDVADLDLAANTVLDEDKFLSPKFKTAVFWKDRLVIANLKARDTSDTTALDRGDTPEASTHKNRIRFSKAFLPDVFPSLFFQDIVPDGDSGEIKRLIVNTARDTLVVFMENDVVELRSPIFDVQAGSLSAPFQNVQGAHGTPSPDSVVEYEGMVFYWTKWGIEVITGTSARNISSDTIGPLWNLLDATHPNFADRVNMAQLPNVRGIVHVDGQGEKILWTYTAGQSSFANRILVLDFSRWRDSGFQDDGVFSLFYNWDIGPMETWAGGGDRNELFGGNSNPGTQRPWVYRLLYGNRDEIGSGIGSTITQSPVDPMEIYLRLLDAGNENRFKRWKVARVEGLGGTATLVVLSFDGEEGTNVDTLDSVSWVDGGVPRYLARNIPRDQIAHYGGIRVVSVDTVIDLKPFELYSASMTVEDIATRRRGGL